MARLIAIDQACSQVSARRDESGKTFLTLRGRSGVITASRPYALRFKGI
jgi:hypothetical protein